MSGKSVKVIAQRGKQRMEFDSIKEAAKSFGSHPNSIRFSHDMKKPHKGCYFTIEKADSKKCASCDTVLTTSKDDYCSKCYYEELTGKPMFEAEKMGLLQTPTIMYQASGQ